MNKYLYKHEVITGQGGLTLDNWDYCVNDEIINTRLSEISEEGWRIKKIKFVLSHGTNKCYVLLEKQTN